MDLVVFFKARPGVHIRGADLKAHLRNQERMWYPRSVIALDVMPMTTSGKILRRTLREGLAGDAYSGKSTQSETKTAHVTEES